MKSIWILLLLISITYSVGCVDNATQTVLIEQGGTIGAVIGFTIVLIAVAYMVGSSMNETQWIVFAKDEIYHLGFSILFLIAFSGIIIGTCTTMDMFFDKLFDSFGTLSSGCHHDGDTMQQTATCYMDKMKRDSLRISQTYIDGYISQIMDSTFSMSLAIPLLNSYTMTGDAYKRIRSNQYDMILNSFLVPALMSINMQQIMLNFIKENIIQWVLPVAFLLRIFIPTRQMGDLLIALVIGIYIVIPFMYVFNFSMYDVVGTPENCEPFAEGICDSVVDGNCQSPVNSDVVCNNTAGFWSVGRLIPFAFFLPNLTLVIFFAFMNAVHKGLKAIG
ncbi:MAG: hypothetical protein ABID61_02925 [Candidatus Micrarchaeota archaeon]